MIVKNVPYQEKDVGGRYPMVVLISCQVYKRHSFEDILKALKHASVQNEISQVNISLHKMLNLNYLCLLSPR